MKSANFLDAQDRRGTVTASDALGKKTGICWAKTNLLAVLVKACGILAGIGYQRLTPGDTPESGYCIHALNAVYMKELDRWIRLNARGNRKTSMRKWIGGRNGLRSV